MSTFYSILEWYSLIFGVKLSIRLLCFISGTVGMLRMVKSYYDACGGHNEYSGDI